MGLNIKNERVHQLAREAAKLTGKSQTGAIEEALVRLLRDHDADPAKAEAARKIDVVRALALAYRSEPGQTASAIRSVDDLYDDSGLPR